MKIISTQQLLVQATHVIFQENLPIGSGLNTRTQTEGYMTSKTAKLHKSKSKAIPVTGCVGL
jgi:hypothetical protein